MKYLTAIILSLFTLTGCGEQTFKGNTYTLTTSPENMPITISFDANENKYYGKAVNNYFGNYVQDKNHLKLIPAGTTMMMASPTEMQAETVYFKELEQVEKFKVADKYLVLILKNNKELLFQKTGVFKK